MRSRYAAYALGLVYYILETAATKRDRTEIDHFCKQTAFTGLDIEAHEEKGEKAHVTFVAHLKQNGRDASFRERSYFEKRNGEWIYCSGEVSSA